MTCKITITPILVHNYVTLNPATWLFGLIRLFTGSYYNHSVIKVTHIYKLNESTYKTDEIIDANLRGVLSRSFSRWCLSTQRECAVCEIPSNYTSIEQLAIIRRELGKMYQFSVYLNRIFGLKDKSDNTLYCFELIERVYGIDHETDGKYYEQFIIKKFTT